MKRRGFSLIEVMIAFAILCVAVLFLLSSIPLMASGLKESENIKGAALVGSDILDRVRNTPFSTVRSAWNLHEGEKSVTGLSNGLAYTTSYIYGTELTPTPSDIQARSLYNVLVTVTWNERGRQKKMLLQTIIFNNDE